MLNDIDWFNKYLEHKRESQKSTSLLLDKQKILDKWRPFLNSLSIQDENNQEWFTNYAEQVEHLQPIIETRVNTSGDTAPTLLPVAMKICAQTIGLDLVSVQPTSFPLHHETEEEKDTRERMIQAKNRIKKLKEILGEEYNEDDYKPIEEPKLDIVSLLYIDYKFDPDNEQK